MSMHLGGPITQKCSMFYIYVRFHGGKLTEKNSFKSEELHNIKKTF